MHFSSIIVSLLAVAASTVFAVEPIIGPSECLTTLLCCQTITTALGVVDPPIVGPITSEPGYFGENCVTVPNLSIAAVCTGIYACCPVLFATPVASTPTPTIAQVIATTSGCAIVDITKS